MTIAQVMLTRRYTTPHGDMLVWFVNSHDCFGALCDGVSAGPCEAASWIDDDAQQIGDVFDSVVPLSVLAAEALENKWED